MCKHTAYILDSTGNRIVCLADGEDEHVDTDKTYEQKTAQRQARFRPFEKQIQRTVYSWPMCEYSDKQLSIRWDYDGFDCTIKKRIYVATWFCDYCKKEIDLAVLNHAVLCCMYQGDPEMESLCKDAMQDETCLDIQDSLLTVQEERDLCSNLFDNLDMTSYIETLKKV